MLFLEERLPIDLRLGASYGDRFAAESAPDPRTGKTYRRLRHRAPARELTGQYTQPTADLWAQLVDLYHRAFGAHAGFRVKFIDDYTTNADTQAPTADDESLAYVSPGVYQLIKTYGQGAPALTGVGYPVRIVFKPVAGTVRIAVDGVEQFSGWSVDTATGRVTFDVPPAISSEITGGCAFDVPCLFSEKFDINHVGADHRETGQIRLIEVLNP